MRANFVLLVALVVLLPVLPVTASLEEAQQLLLPHRRDVVCGMWYVVCGKSQKHPILHTQTLY